MLPDEDRVRLTHMMEAADKALLFLESKHEEDLFKDEKLALAITRLVEIIGEAAAKVSDTVRADHPEIPWKSIIGTRNRLIHGYFNVDLEVLWQIVLNDLPQITKNLQMIVAPVNQ